ncbi:MAG TPA: YceI family protein [Chitinophagales bacterium]|nr:YceI family protein [Chitinophagales bacterium]
MKSKFKFLALTLLVIGSLAFIKCNKDDSITPLSGTPIAGTAKIDATWTFDKVHSNVGWQSPFMDFSATMLTGRFNSFGFTPAFIFDETNLSQCSLNAWVQLSTFNTGESGRDSYGKCGLNYLGITYLDSLKTLVNPASDTAWVTSNTFQKVGTGYVATGTFTFNRYRAPSGFADGTRITKPITIYVSYNGTTDFDSNGDGVNDKLRAGFTTSFTFNRSDYVDVNSTKAFDPFIPDDATAATNTTYGVWSSSVADEMTITVNSEFYLNH